MPIFDAKQSAQGSIAYATLPTTVDIGISDEVFRTLRHQHSGIFVAVERLATDQDIDRAINRLIGELDELRSTAKELLRSLKR